MSLPVWRFAFASAIGNSHIDNQLPCQDYCQVEVYQDTIISVVCDGAGSATHSDLGAKQVVLDCLSRFADAMKSKAWHKEKKFPTLSIWHEVAKDTLKRVRQDLENFSLAAELPLKSLACTVIVVINLKNGLLVTHIGDGRAGYCNQAGEWFPLIKPFHGEEANETVFITSDIWTSELQEIYIESAVIKNDVKAFCLLSDGCEKAAFECNLYDSEKEVFYDPNRPYPLFFDANVAALPKLFENGSTQEEINSQWQIFLTNGNGKLRVESDDKTLILAVKVPNKI